MSHTVLTCGSADELSDFFFTCLRSSMFRAESRRISDEQVRHKSDLLAELAWRQSHPIGSELHIARALEFAGAKMLQETGFFRAQLIRLSNDWYVEHSNQGAMFFHEAAVLEPDRDRKLLLSTTCRYFDYWQGLLERAEWFCRTELPLIMGPIKGCILPRATPTLRPS